MACKNSTSWRPPRSVLNKNAREGAWVPPDGTSVGNWSGRIDNGTHTGPCPRLRSARFQEQSQHNSAVLQSFNLSF